MPIWKPGEDDIYTVFLSQNVSVQLNEQKEIARRQEGAAQLTDAELYKQYGSMMVQAIVDDHCRYPESLYSNDVKKDLDATFKAHKPDYKPLTSEEVKERRAASRKLQIAFTKFTAESNINSSPAFFPQGDHRVEKALLHVGTDPETFRKNQELIRHLFGTEEERKKAIRERVHEIAEIDLGKIDLLDPNSVADHMKEIGELMAVGPELPNDIRNYLTEPEDQVLWNKMNEMFDAASQMRLMIDTHTSPLYSAIRLESLTDVTDQDTLKEVGQPNLLTDASHISSAERDLIDGMFAQHTSLNVMYGKSVFRDTAKTPQERSDSYLASFWDKYKENNKIAGVRPLLVENTQSEWFRAVQEEANKIQNRIPELKQGLQRSIELMKKKDPSFTMTQEQIDEMFTPERILTSAQMRAYVNLRNKYVGLQEANMLPVNMRRMMHVFENITSTDDAQREKDRREFLLKMTDDSGAGRKARQQMAIEQINKIKDLDASKIDDPDFLSGKKSLASMAPWLLEHANETSMAFEAPNFIGNLEKSLGLKMQDQNLMQAFIQKGQVLGSDANSLMNTIGSDAFFQVPLDHMSVGLLGELLADHDETVKICGLDGSNAVNILYVMKNNFVNNIPAVEQEPKESLNEKSLIYGDKVPQVTAFLQSDSMTKNPEKELLGTLNDLRKQLDNEDKWYDWNNSKQFKDLKKTLAETTKMLDRSIEEGIPADNELLKQLSSLSKDYAIYANNKGDGPKNQRQENRRKISNALVEEIAKYQTTDKVNEENAANLERLATEARREEINANPEMQLFEKGIRRTDNMSKELEGKTGIEKELMSNMIDARNELANQSGRREPNAEIVGKQMGRIIASQLLLQQKNQLDKKLGQDPKALSDTIRKTEEMVVGSKTLKDMAKKMSGHDINEFLAGTGEKEMTKKFIAGYHRESVDRTAEISASKAMKRGKDLIGEAKPEKPVRKPKEAGF